MKTLSLLRHAKSGWDDMIERDFDRPLNGKGQRAAQAIGTAAMRNGLAPDWIIASPAVRVAETLAIFLPAAGLDGQEPHWDRRVYLASSATLAELIRETPDSVGHLLLAGHNPGLEDMILDLVPDLDGDALRDAVEEKFPTAALATLELDIDHWNAVGDAPSRLIRFIRPRDLDPSLGPDND